MISYRNFLFLLPIFKHCLYQPISDNFLDYVDTTLLFLPKQKPILNGNDIWNRLRADFFRHYKNGFMKNGKINICDKSFPWVKNGKTCSL